MGKLKNYKDSLSRGISLIVNYLAEKLIMTIETLITIFMVLIISSLFLLFVTLALVIGVAAIILVVLFFFSVGFFMRGDLVKVFEQIVD